MSNRLGFTNFIEDKEKIDKHYEWVLNKEENFIDELDHLFIALVTELGAEKEVEIELKEIALQEQLKIIKKLKEEVIYWKVSFNKQVEATR